MVTGSDDEAMREFSRTDDDDISALQDTGIEAEL